ncbi:MAG: hypothetical protein PHN72_00725 [Bacilli bacterium]|nr:hypothetical protein [Bacilli bacterium]
MNLYLLNLVGKWIGILFVSGLSFFGGYTEKEVKAVNTNKNRSLNLTTEWIAHSTEVRYNDQKPNGEQTVLVEGIDGYLVRNHDNNEIKIVKNPVTEVVEIGTYVQKPVVTTVSNVATASSYTGKLTMYTNCPNRSVCKTSSGHNLKDSVYYTDQSFGTVRILSAALNAFPKGTIVEVSGASVGNFYGIVLDTGGSMQKAWSSGNVWMDLAIDASTEKAYTDKHVTFNIKRYGF